MTAPDPVEHGWLELVAGLMASPLTALPAEPIALRLIETYRARGCVVHVQAPGRPPLRRTWPDDLAGEDGIAHDRFALALHAGPQEHTVFVIGRDTPFSEAELRLADLLRRLLSGLDGQARALARRRGRTCVDTVAADVGLTPREIAVLSGVAAGRTAGATGHRLGISERTVHKHLERGYAKLGVSDRVSAVLRAQQLGVLD